MSEPVTSAHVARGLGTTLLARLGALIDLVAQPIYVWMFGLASYGLYALLWGAVNLVENVADLGMTGALQRTVPQAKDAREEAAALGTALAWGVLPCLTIAAGASLFAPQVAPLFNVAYKDEALLTGAIRLFAWSLPLWAFVEIATAALRAKRLFGPEIRLRIFWEQVIRLGLALALWQVFGTIVALLVAHLASLAIVAALCLRLLARHYDLSALAVWHCDTVRAGLAVLPNQGIARLFGDGPPLLLGAVLPGAAGATSAGLYVIARKLSSIVQLVRTAFAYVLAPLASTAAKGGPAEVGAIYAFSTRVSTALALPLGASLIGGSLALLALFGREGLTAYPALVLLIQARTIEAALGAAGPLLQVVGRHSAQLAISVAALAAAAVVLIALPLDVDVVASVVLAGVVTTSVITLLLLGRQGLSPFGWPFRRTALVAAAIASVAWLAAFVAAQLPLAYALAAVTLVTAAALWLSLRLALPAADRAALGGLGRRLGLS